MKSINVSVYDRNDRPIPGAAVTWKVKHKGQELTLGPVTTTGFLNSSADIQIKDENQLDEPFLDVTASYGGETHRDRISIDKINMQSHWISLGRRRRNNIRHYMLYWHLCLVYFF